MYEFSTLGWVRHVCFHPTEGFEDLRWKKQGSVKLSLFIVLLLFIAMVANNRMVGFAFNTNTVKVFNVVPLVVQSVVYFATWVIGNWCICTLLDGEGTLKKICIYSAYALVPYILCSYAAVILSNFLILEEAIWVNFFNYLGMGWSIVLMISASDAADTLPGDPSSVALPAGLCICIHDLHRDRVQDTRLMRKGWCEMQNKSYKKVLTFALVLSMMMPIGSAAADTAAETNAEAETSAADTEAAAEVTEELRLRRQKRRMPRRQAKARQRLTAPQQMTQPLKQMTRQPRTLSPKRTRMKKSPQ